MKGYEQQYLEALQKILDEGEWIKNERTGEECLTLINLDFEYGEECPLLTTKQSYPVSAVAEMIGYLRGYTNAQDFADIGTKTWFDNANKTQSWLDNPIRLGENDMGKCYGAVAKDFGGVDLIESVFKDLSNHIDNRGEIITFWKPDDFDKACLRPCMYSHHFSIVGDKLYLTSTQRSADMALGQPYNAIQCWFLLNLAAKVTGLKVGKCYHKVVNAHIYKSHLEGVYEQLSRKPLKSSHKVVIQDWVKTFEDVTHQDLHARAYISVDSYEHLGKIEFEMIA